MPVTVKDLFSDQLEVYEQLSAWARHPHRKARALPPMTEKERLMQALDFAYGNLACSTNHKPSRRAFALLARDHGMALTDFWAWADGKEWAP